MTKIEDISPTWSNSNITSAQSVNGRMLSLATSPDGRVVLAGSYSNLWLSTDGGQTWDQVTWPQPAQNQFGVPGSLGGWGVMDIAVSPDFGPWRVDRHPRLLADVDGDGRADIVAFGDTGVWIALSNGDGTFHQPYLAVADFGYEAGGWRVDKHPRFLAPLTTGGRPDIVGFGDAGVWVSFNNGDGTFQPPRLVVPNFGYDQGWRVDRHPRFLADLTGKGRADIVGFGDAGVWIAFNDGAGNFQDPATDPNQPLIKEFGYNQGWRVEKHLRLLADVTGKGPQDILGFGDAGVIVALSNGDGTFQQLPQPGVANFGYNQDWRVEKHPRFLAPLTRQNRADILGFGDGGVYTGLSNGDGTFQDPAQDPNQPVIADLGYVAGGWRVEKHPRMPAKLTTGPWADVVGFGDAGVWTALNNGDGTFQAPKLVLLDFGYEAGGWRVEKHPRFLADITGDGRADIVGFGDDGVWTALGKGDGTFQAPQLVLTDFGANPGGTVLALTRNDRQLSDRGVWRSTDGGNNWQQVHMFPPVPGQARPAPAGQIAWAPGSDRWVFVAGGSSVAVSEDGGANFDDVFPWGSGPDPLLRANHVAASPGTPGNPTSPQVVYVLGNGKMFVSFDCGGNWIEDQGNVSASAGGGVGTALSQTPSVLVVSPRSPLEVFMVDNAQGTPAIYRGDYSNFFTTHASQWTPLPMPNLSDQDSGNVFVATTRPGQGELLFYGAQRSEVYVSSLDPASASDWHTLPSSGSVHPDLHGIFLSPDFTGVFQDGHYHPTAGTVWLLSDGGIYRSTDGGQNFQSVQKLRTLSSVIMAGAALPGQGPALSLNTGDNDGFFSLDGGGHWASQDYGGGDNDCAFADPLDGTRMLVFTPRWSNSVTLYKNELGGLPDAQANTTQRHTIPGPPVGGHIPNQDPPDSWNARSTYGLRGSRPIVLTKPGESVPGDGDYIFIRFKTDHRAVLLRTQSLLDIDSPDAWDTTANTPYEGQTVYQVGPELPAQDIGLVQASGGHASTVFYVGGDAQNRLWKWSDGMTAWQQIIPSPTADEARRFFVDPYRPNLLYLLDAQNVRRSEDGGETWQEDQNFEQMLACGGLIPIARGELSGESDHFVEEVLTDMQFDPYHSLVRFAVGEGGVFFTVDGLTWNRLLDTGALPGRPSNCYYDWVTNPCERVLYVAFSGRSLVKIWPLPWGSGQALDPNLWSQNVRAQGQLSKSTPAAAAFQNQMWMVRNNDDNNDLVWTTSADGLNWAPAQPVSGQKSKAGATIAVFNNVLHMVHLGDSSNNIWWSTNDGTGWTPNVKIPNQASQTLPALVAFNNRFFMLHTGDGSNDIYISEFDKNSNSWSTNTVIQGQLSKSPIKAAVFQGKIHMVHLGDSSNSIWWSVFDLTTGWWSNTRIRCQLSQSVPALAVHNNLLHMIHQGDSENTVWWSVYDGTEWTPNLTLPGQLSKSGAALCETPDQSNLVLLHLGDSSNQVWFSEI